MIIKKTSLNNASLFFSNIQPIRLNDVGQIVSGDFVPSIILDSGEKIDINQSLELEFDLSTPWVGVHHIYDINNSGQMVGVGTIFGDSSTHAVLLVPVSDFSR